VAMLLKAGSGILYMKVGTHAKESLAEIIQRKREEIEHAGYALWGYGGNTCHPLSMVQPFARDFERRAGKIYLCMQPMDSKHFAEPLRATESSVDGHNWQVIPEGVNVLGSRYALVIKDLHEERFSLALTKTRVAIGPCLGRTGDQYIAGRVDKACLEVVDDGVTIETDEPSREIQLVAEIADPFAVFVR